ncbi:conjugal transfer protein TraH (plasmid) [Providencia huaxiensis]|uniref:Conjugal transfer protein n=9 Tax=Enterobacterales TaxID=91347 RepID=A0A7L8KA90_ECOLX|nr:MULTISPECIES: conjugal transfer protein TraH [Enterobacterales]ELB1214827.1 conjugal transfer protein TraH [Proteus mirabilis]ELY4881470.1 conjugal transfer protein TraH [Morganella morganii]SPY66628.1 conjugal transfer pilus assembly protein TraH [Providencia stuartii]SUC33756.1 conjugal transfer pilus assembly protein TraH [Providencia rustigianii]ELR5094269.1 conjugal transfer protein TraH [Providencia rettgeri]
MKIDTQKCKSSKSMKRSILSSLVLMAGLLSFTSNANADSINDQLNNMFGSMSNTTRPGDYHSVTRDGYTGGGFTLRNKLRSLTPVNIQLPSAAGGCGGIDLFGGSFSFINADEFVQMLRNIAANASGLAFQLALNAMDAVLDNAISRMQAVIQQMNDLTANSCQLAKGLLVDTAAAFGSEAKASVSAQLSSDGLSDQFDAFMGGMNGSKSSPAKKEDAGKRVACKDYGNLMWCLLNNGQFTNQFLGSTDQQKEFIMSITGTYIVPKNISTDDTGNLIGGAPILIAPLDTSDALEALVNGNTAFDIYKCTDTESCANPQTTTLAITGLAQKIIQFFDAEGYLSDVVAGTPLTTSQLQKALFFNSIGASSNASSMAKYDINLATAYVKEIAPILAYSAANQYLRDMLTAAATSAKYEIDNNNPAAESYAKTIVLISEARQRLADSYLAYTSKYGGESKIIELRDTFMKGIPVQKFEESQKPLSAQ